jgi:hypothetical protein
MIDFPKNLMMQYGVGQKTQWHNNNWTITQNAYVLDVTDVEQVAKIFSEVSKHNNSSAKPINVVAVSGYNVTGRGLSCITRLEKEYAQSFSLSIWSTGKNADIILRTSKVMQQLYLFHEGDEHFLRVTGDVRITDADDYLLKKGYVLDVNMPTLHVASIIGAAANGCYGPARDSGPMTTNIVEMKVIDAFGKPHTFSAKENPDLFAIFRDFHMGSAFFVTELTLKNIQKKFMMKRKNVLFKDVDDFKIGMAAKNRINDEHFAVMYIPVDMHDKGNHFPRIRVTTMERTKEVPKRDITCREQHDLSAYLDLITTELGEPIINQVVEVEELREFFPLVLKAGAIKTYGLEKETEEIDWAPHIYHIFATYTKSPLDDINWLITVGSPDEARDLLGELFTLVEKKLLEYADRKMYPLFNAFARFLKGIYFPEGQGGATCTATDSPNQFILSFEMLTFPTLGRTPEFQSLVNEVVTYLKDHGYKFTYHPGKTWPDSVTKFSDFFDDEIRAKRLQNTKDAIVKLLGGLDNVRIAPTMTPQKKSVFGFEEEAQPEEFIMQAARIYTVAEKRAAVKMIKKLAKEQNDTVCRNKAQALLKH